MLRFKAVIELRQNEYCLFKFSLTKIHVGSSSAWTQFELQPGCSISACIKLVGFELDSSLSQAWAEFELELDSLSVVVSTLLNCTRCLEREKHLYFWPWCPRASLVECFPFPRIRSQFLFTFRITCFDIIDCVGNYSSVKLDGHEIRLLEDLKEEKK